MDEIEMKKPAPPAVVHTPRKRKSFGKKDVRKLHRQDNTTMGLKKWANINSKLVLRAAESQARYLTLSLAASKIL